MRICLLPVLIALALLLSPGVARAQVVMSEVMWAGSDQSTADEWIELHNASDKDIDLSGWAIQYLASSGSEETMLMLPEGALLSPGGFFVIANNVAADSRLASEPDFVTSAVSLPNTKLLLKVRNPVGDIVDIVDDGTGSPFAGSNADPKASMERLDPLALGTEASNWATAVSGEGFDEGSSLLGSPGLPNSVRGSVSSSSSLSSSSSSSSSSSVCSDSLEIAIFVQDGELKGEGKTTVNFQAVAVQGSLEGVPCRWEYGDGYRPESCNPPPHAFNEPGSYTVHLEAINHCGNTLIQEELVEVYAPPDNKATGESTVPPYDGSRVRFSSALPNPEGADTGREWIELRNLEERVVRLEGWQLAVGEEKVKKSRLKGSISPRGTLRIYSSEGGFVLPNAASRLQLLDPTGIRQSLIRYSEAKEQQLVYPDDLRETGVHGRVVSMPNALVLDLIPEDEAALYLSDVVQIRLLGLMLPELSKETAPILSASFQAVENVRALLEGKNLDLEFDSDMWDEEGRLQGYVFLKGGLFLHESVLLSGSAFVDPSCECTRKNQLLTYEESAKEKGVGVWSVRPHEDTILQVLTGSSLDQHLFSLSRADLRISEVYSHPSREGENALMKQEWVEVRNFSDKPVDLAGWKLAIGEKLKSIVSGLLMGSGGFLVLTREQVSLKLRDGGNTLALISPDGTDASSVNYPKLGAGVSYSWSDERAGFCIARPTPGFRNECVDGVLPTKISAKARAAIRKSQKIAGYAAAYKAESSTGSTVIQVGNPSDRVYGRMVIAFTIGLLFAGAGFVALRWLRPLIR